MIKKNVPKAKMHLKRKKMHQETAERLLQQELNLEQMKFKLEEVLLHLCDFYDRKNIVKGFINIMFDIIFAYSY